MENIEEKVENEATIECVTFQNNLSSDCHPDCGPNEWCLPNACMPVYD